MPRTLPWMKKADTTSPQRRPGKTSTRVKRPRLLDPSSDIESGAGGDPGKQRLPRSRVSSPPVLDPPSECSMDEGLDKDDQYRMVEDEFLEIAKNFTQHLHAAEYQRLKKVARSQNADTINSISRPVTTRMPDETRRKVEGVSRSKRQATAVQSLIDRHGKESESEDDFDEKRGPWVGTALHGLMESPQRSSASLTNVADIVSSTRAAAGFSKLRSNDLSEASTASSRISHVGSECLTESEDDDDLDLPILKERSDPTTVTAITNSFPIGTDSATESNSARERIARRMALVKLQESKKQEQVRKPREIIPTFLL